jgi:hypothetical protein
VKGPEFNPQQKNCKSQTANMKDTQNIAGQVGPEELTPEVKPIEHIRKVKVTQEMESKHAQLWVAFRSLKPYKNRIKIQCN